MKINLVYSLISGGTYGGLPALFLRPGGKEVEALKVVQTIRETTQSLGMKKGILVIDDSTEAFDPETLPQIMDLGLCLEGFDLIGMSDGKRTPSFLRTVGYRIAVIDNEPWFKYTANEIWFEPESSLDEPDVGLNNLPKLKFIRVNNRITLTDAIKFAQNSQLMWGIINQPKKTIEVQIL